MNKLIPILHVIFCNLNCFLIANSRPTLQCIKLLTFFIDFVCSCFLHIYSAIYNEIFIFLLNPFQQILISVIRIKVCYILYWKLRLRYFKIFCYLGFYFQISFKSLCLSEHSNIFIGLLFTYLTSKSLSLSDSSN